MATRYHPRYTKHPTEFMTSADVPRPFPDASRRFIEHSQPDRVQDACDEDSRDRRADSRTSSFHPAVPNGVQMDGRSCWSTTNAPRLEPHDGIPAAKCMEYELKKVIEMQSEFQTSGPQRIAALEASTKKTDVRIDKLAELIQQVQDDQRKHETREDLLNELDSFAQRATNEFARIRARENDDQLKVHWLEARIQGLDMLTQQIRDSRVQVEAPLEDLRSHCDNKLNELRAFATEKFEEIRVRHVVFDQQIDRLGMLPQQIQEDHAKLCDLEAFRQQCDHKLAKLCTEASQLSDELSKVRLKENELEAKIQKLDMIPQQIRDALASVALLERFCNQSDDKLSAVAAKTTADFMEIGAKYIELDERVKHLGTLPELIQADRAKLDILEGFQLQCEHKFAKLCSKSEMAAKEVAWKADVSSQLSDELGKVRLKENQLEARIQEFDALPQEVGDAHQKVGKLTEKLSAIEGDISFLKQFRQQCQSKTASASDGFVALFWPWSSGVTIEVFKDEKERASNELRALRNELSDLRETKGTQRCNEIAEVTCASLERKFMLELASIRNEISDLRDREYVIEANSGVIDYECCSEIKKDRDVDLLTHLPDSSSLADEHGLQSAFSEQPPPPEVQDDEPPTGSAEVVFDSPPTRQTVDSNSGSSQLSYKPHFSGHPEDEPSRRITLAMEKEILSALRSTTEEKRKLVKQLLLKAHPDKGGSDNAMDWLEKWKDAHYDWFLSDGKT